jgi:2-haloacid dehalogenase
MRTTKTKTCEPARVAREAQTILKTLGYSLDWLAFADAWRVQYQPGMDESARVKFPSASSM